MAAVGSALVVVFFWGLCWAVYCALGAPDILLGGVALERLVRPTSLPAASGPFALMLVPAAGLASFWASSVSLRERIGSLDVTGGGEIGHDLGLWSAIIGAAALASFWPTEPWALVQIALGIATSTLAPAVVLPPPASRARWGTWAGLVGLAIFGALALAGQWTGGGLPGGIGGWTGLPLAYPAVAAAPVAAAIVWAARRAVRR